MKSDPRLMTHSIYVDQYKLDKTEAKFSPHLLISNHVQILTDTAIKTLQFTFTKLPYCVESITKIHKIIYIIFLW